MRRYFLSEDGGNNNTVDSSNVEDGKDFKSTQISTTSFDSVAHTVLSLGSAFTAEYQSPSRS